ncbi:MAG TPA: ABC transporter ATP-binding protein [Cytophagaceae bacterium]|nr:ABC transporter ATP-binding protein [Cytophagaceae bacterium]
MLSVRNLQISIAQKVLVKDLSFEINQPAFIAVIGHNGSGKTSLFKAFSNLLPYQGEIFFSSPPALLSQKNTIHFEVTARELAVMGKFREKKFFEFYDQQDFSSAEQLFKKLGISRLKESNVLSLSGGEQQLVWLAQLLLQNREILLLDEPTQYLDLQYKKRVFDLMSTLVKEEQKTILCITHDLLNLYKMEGYLLNLSRENPVLETLSKEVIDQNLALLEQYNV